jgi:uncharacterized coiled-coil protein SlyX
MSSAELHHDAIAQLLAWTEDKEKIIGDLQLKVADQSIVIEALSAAITAQAEVNQMLLQAIQRKG